MTIVDPIRDERGWRFVDPDPVNHWGYLSQAYQASDPGYRGRVTVPVLWDTATHRIVSNSDDDIMRMFETEFDAFGDAGLDLYPQPLRSDIDVLNEKLYETFNNGVYRAGFATSQRAYERAAYRVFETLDAMDRRLADRRYLFGARPVETDWRFFVTLIRFDAVYFGHFKCNLRRIVDYPNLSGYLRDLYQIDGVADTVDFDHIKRHYYATHEQINPTRIVPIGPLQDFDAPHGRERLSGSITEAPPTMRL
jgi:glutathionyl-hydroquinone reductase